MDFRLVLFFSSVYSYYYIIFFISSNLAPKYPFFNDIYKCLTTLLLFNNILLFSKIFLHLFLFYLVFKAYFTKKWLNKKYGALHWISINSLNLSKFIGLVLNLCIPRILSRIKQSPSIPM